MLVFYIGMFYSNEDWILVFLKIQVKFENIMLNGRSQVLKVEYYDFICMKCLNEVNLIDRDQQLSGVREEQCVVEL